MRPPITVDIWSDIACPWCFIGKRRFETAVAQFDGQVDVEYHSFELAPDTPADFVGSEVDFLVQHKGMPEQQVRQMLDQVTQIAAAEGLSYDFESVQHTNTLLAHQALHAAKEQGRQSELVERLLSAYFEQGRQLGRIDELVALGADVGLDPVALREALAAGSYRDAVAADIAQAREYGISGVPFFVVDGTWGISGAQEPQVFTQVLERAASEGADR